ncbi:MAG: YhjD/YihY/BrkB family envelope integrity protein, partial [Pseudonocardiaceae bacterium]
MPRYARPNPLVSRLRGLVLFALIGTVVLITTALSAVGTAATDFLMTTPLSAGGSGVGTGVRIVAIAVAAIVNVAAFLIGFRVLSAREVRLADLLPGAVGAGVAIQVLQTLARCSSVANSSVPRRSTACSGWFSDCWPGCSAGGHRGVLR